LKPDKNNSHMIAKKKEKKKKKIRLGDREKAL